MYIFLLIMPTSDTAGALYDDARLTSVCLSVCRVHRAYVENREA